MNNSVSFNFILKWKKFGILSSISICILLIFISLFIYDCSTFSIFHTFKSKVEEWVPFWSLWAVQFLFFSSIYLIWFHIYLVNCFKNKQKLNEKVVVIAQRLIVLNLTYLFSVLVIYNVAFVVSPSIVYNNPLTVVSIFEHQLAPILFILYFILNNKIICWNDNKKTKKWIKSNCLISIIYPAIYLFSMICICKFDINVEYPYSQFDIDKYGIITILYCLFAIFLSMLISFLLSKILVNEKSIFKGFKNKLVIFISRKKQ